MQEVTTIPGKTYAVECAGEVVITNNETGAIAAQGDGSGQVLFTACGNSYSVSDDTAKVVALFKVAPRLRLTLLQGVAGGLLPAGYMELEYLESSGTQYIDTGIIPTANTGLLLDNQLTTQDDTIPFGCRNTSSSETRFYAVRAPRNFGQGWFLGYGWGEWVGFPAAGGDMRISARLNWLGSAKVEGSGFVRSLSTLPFEPQYSLFLFSANIGGAPGLSFKGRIWHAAISEGSRVVFSAVPALRKSDGVPGMFDTVSKQFFTNAGTGVFGYRVKGAPAAFSLRDPHRVAPSGVYARKAGENELEIVADTDDVTGDGWEWFANTGEAYDTYGIVIQDELN
jgi:hypothetical protein